MWGGGRAVLTYVVWMGHLAVTLLQHPLYTGHAYGAGRVKQCRGGLGWCARQRATRRAAVQSACVCARKMP